MTASNLDRCRPTVGGAWFFDDHLLFDSYHPPARDIHYRSLFRNEDEDSRAYNRRYLLEDSYSGERFRPKSSDRSLPP